ncbi:MAG TPA: hypothetical protein VGN46_14095 [Luteibacter sp.]|uniref:hypothetical protein n=1 Tax=Luteibacter sp. TaxID=1886636 RepID=UPI002F411612
MLNKKYDRRDRTFNHAVNLFDRALLASGFGDGVTTPVLAVAAIEALPYDMWVALNLMKVHWETCINNPEVPKLPNVSELCEGMFGRHRLDDAEETIYRLTDSLDFDKEKLIEKYKLLHKAVGCGELDRQPEALADVSLLISVRNSIIHPKSEHISQRLKGGKTHGNPNGIPSFVHTLWGKGLINKPSVSESWLNLIDDVRFCRWSVQVAFRFIQVTLIALPESPLLNAFTYEADLRRSREDVTRFGIAVPEDT